MCLMVVLGNQYIAYPQMVHMNILGIPLTLSGVTGKREGQSQMHLYFWMEQDKDSCFLWIKWIVLENGRLEFSWENHPYKSDLRDKESPSICSQGQTWNIPDITKWLISLKFSSMD